MVLAVSWALFIASLVMHRLRIYQRDLPLDAEHDDAYDFVNGESTAITVEIDHDGLTLPDASFGDTAFLALRLEATSLGSLIDPALEISSGKNRDTIVFERGVRGLRYVDVSRVLGTERRVHLTGHHLRWDPQRATLRHWNNRPLDADDRVLVIAPHPDDAEIAAHAFYSGHKTNIATISAGDRSRIGLARLEPRASEHSRLAARLRAWNSLTVPWLVGVPPGDVVQLGYPDGRLGEMFDDKHRSLDVEYDRAEVREMNRAPVDLPVNRPCTWTSLVADLRGVLHTWSPTVIIVPFPKYDNHPDHGFATAAVVEALNAVSGPRPRVLMYVNHSLLTEAWPFGPAGGGLSLPPNHDDNFRIHGLWSFPTSAEARRDKNIALSAMHDLRDASEKERPTLAEMLAEARSLLGAKVRGTDHHPNNYFRRAVRSSELFFVVTLDQLCAISDEFLRDNTRQPDEPTAAIAPLVHR